MATYYKLVLNYELSFEELLFIDGSFSVHHRNVQAVAIEMYKQYHKMSPKLIAEIYDIKNRYWKMGPRLTYPTVGDSFAFAKNPYDSSILLVGGCQYNTDEERVGQCDKVLSIKNCSSKQWEVIRRIPMSRIDAVAMFVGNS